jgi:ribosomal protein S4
MIAKKSKFKPLYKQFIRLRENVQNRKRLLKFKSKKWDRFLQFYKRKLKRYKKFKPNDQIQYIVSKFPSKANSYEKRFKNTLDTTKRLRLFYGGLSKKYLKKQIKQTLRKKTNKKLDNFYLKFIGSFEHRLDTILYRAKFSISLRNSRQLIVHGKIMVNNKVVRIPSYYVNPGDLISVKKKDFSLIEKNIKDSIIWPIPPKYLSIKYKTMEILVNDHAHKNNLSTSFPFNLNLEKILISYYKH